MADGTATPEEITAFQARAQARAVAGSQALRDMAADMIEHRGEPMLIMGLWTQHWAIIQQAREMGLGDRAFHPDTIIYTGGGLKGMALPADYRERIYAFYGTSRRYMAYGMTETGPTAPMCEAGRYHRPPWVMWLVLDREGERLAPVGADGVAKGRFAFLAVNYQGRWGGLITGDRVQMDHGTCPCGRPGPTVLDTISRYTELDGGDDKIGSAGSMEAYMRGMVGA